MTAPHKPTPYMADIRRARARLRDPEPWGWPAPLYRDPLLRLLAEPEPEPAEPPADAPDPDRLWQGIKNGLAATAFLAFLALVIWWRAGRPMP